MHAGDSFDDAYLPFRIGWDAVMNLRRAVCDTHTLTDGKARPVHCKPSASCRARISATLPVSAFSVIDPLARSV